MNFPSSQDKPIHLFVELQESELVQQLRRENKELTELLASERLKRNNAEMKLIDEGFLNDELIDLLRANNIPFRDLLSRKNRNK